MTSAVQDTHTTPYTVAMTIREDKTFGVDVTQQLAGGSIATVSVVCLNAQTLEFILFQDAAEFVGAVIYQRVRGLEAVGASPGLAAGRYLLRTFTNPDGSTNVFETETVLVVNG